MEEWKQCKLGDICNISSSKRIFAEEYVSSGIPFYRGKEIIEKHNKNTVSSELFITHERFAEIKSKFPVPQIDDILLTSVGTLGIPWLVNESNFYFKDGNLTWFRSNTEKVNPKFLYYWFESNYAKNQIDSMCIGSTQKALTIDTLSKFSINLPSLPTQQKIAAILSSLDDKIELNNKINANLEQQAGALFKNWFVDFEPFGGKMPERWKVGKLSDYCNFQEGYVNPAQTHNEYFDGDVKWLRAVDINESFIINTSRTLTKCGFESAGKSAFLFKPGSIAISKSGTVGRLGIISDFMCGNRAVIGIKLKDQQNLSYIHQYLKSRQTEFPDMAVGSVQKNLYVSILENLDIIIPSKEVLEKYAKICMPLYNQIKTNCIENDNLSSIRDTLLPKLMNGEIEV